MARTNDADVQAIVDTSISDTTPWIEIATEIVDDVESQATNPDAGRLEKLEKLVAAHLLTSQDKNPRAESRSGGERSISYSGDHGEGFNGTDHGQAALALENVIGTNVLANSTLPSASISVDDVKSTDPYP